MYSLAHAVKLMMILGIIAGFINYSGLSLPYRLILWQILAGFIADIAAMMVGFIYHNNLYIYNCYEVVDFWLLLAAANLWLTGNIKRLLPLAGACFTIPWVYYLIRDGLFGNLITIPLLIGSLFLTLIYLVIILQLYNKGTTALHREPVFWIALGIILQYGGNIPMWSTFEYILKKHLSTVGQNLNIINMVLNFIRYSAFLISFLLLYRRSWTARRAPLNYS